MAHAQYIDVTAANSAFNPVLKFGSSGYTYLTDPQGDQQTGTGGTGGDSDFVGNANTTPGFLMTYGLINGVSQNASDTYVAFRFRLDTFRSQGYNTDTVIGIDANGDGVVDLFVGVTLVGNTIKTEFQLPGSGLNVSPNTTTLLSPTNQVAVNSSTFSYVDSTVANGGVDGTTTAGTNDALLTFAVQFSTLQTALANLGITVTDTTPMRFIGFTATQNNSINQDVYGIGKLSDPYLDSNGNPVPYVTYTVNGTTYTVTNPTNGDVPFANFASTPTDSHGNVPEPATYGVWFLTLAGAAAGLGRWRKRQRPVAVGRREPVNVQDRELV